MPVRYVQLSAVSKLFSPVVRAFGNIAIIGATTAANPKSFDIFTDPDTANTEFPGDLGTAIALAFNQTPGPTVVYGIPATGADFTNAFATASTLDVQIVALANTPLTATTATPATAGNPGGVHFQLFSHVNNISKEDGKERIGVAMLPQVLPQDSIDLSNIINLKSDRMVYIAHKTKQDVAAAVAGTIAGYEPSVSLLLKPVQLIFTKADPFIPFTPSEIELLNGSEDNSGPSPTGATGKGVNWLTSPSLLPGGGIYMGEGYTGDTSPGGVKFIDVRRTIDDLSFRLKARMIKSIGNLRISRSDLRSLIAQMEATLDPFVRSNILSSYEIILPLLILLDKNPDTLTPSEHQQIIDAQANRVVQVLVIVEYEAAIHRLAITLQFQ